MQSSSEVDDMLQMIINHFFFYSHFNTSFQHPVFISLIECLLHITPLSVYMSVKPSEDISFNMGPVFISTVYFDVFKAFLEYNGVKRR